MKNHYLIEDCFLDDYTIIVYFAINQELGYRKLEIDIDDLDTYFDNNGVYEMSDDYWDYTTESHYTKDWKISFDEYWTDYYNSDDVRDYLENYFLTNELPNIEEE
jgi:hypothetical protein